MKQQQQKYQNTYYVSPPYLPTCQVLYRHHVILQTIEVLLSTMLGNQSTLIKSVGKRSMCLCAPANISEIIVHFKKINIKPAFESWLNCKPGDRHGGEGEDGIECSRGLLTF